MDQHSATAQNGPLAGQWGLTVADQDESGRWPSPIVWSAGGRRHVYDLMALAADSETALEPIYAFRETLGATAASPEAGWILPPHYLM
jgi:hypothetical protein